MILQDKPLRCASRYSFLYIRTSRPVFLSSSTLTLAGEGVACLAAFLPSIGTRIAEPPLPGLARQTGKIQLLSSALLPVCILDQLHGENYREEGRKTK